jgi:hypothetical protein
MPDMRDPLTSFKAAKRRFAVKGRGSSGLREKRGRSRIGGWSDGCYETRAGCCCGCWDRGWNEGCYETRAGCCYRRWDRDWSDSCYETRAGCCCGCWDRGWSDGCYETRAGCCCGCWDRGWNEGCYETKAGCCCGRWDKGCLGAWGSPNGPGDREDRIIQKPELRDRRPELLE